jgi:hypothetical protein
MAGIYLLKKASINTDASHRLNAMRKALKPMAAIFILSSYTGFFRCITMKLIGSIALCIHEANHEALTQ